TPRIVGIMLCPESYIVIVQPIAFQCTWGGTFSAYTGAGIAWNTIPGGVSQVGIRMPIGRKSAGWVGCVVLPQANWLQEVGKVSQLNTVVYLVYVTIIVIWFGVIGVIRLADGGIQHDGNVQQGCLRHRTGRQPDRGVAEQRKERRLGV